MSVSRILTAAWFVLATRAAPLWAQGGGEGGGGLYDINTGLSVWTLIVFGALVFILGKFAWGPILSAVEAREKKIQSALDEAAERNAEARKLLEEHREQLADARRQASEVVSDAKAAGERVRKEIEEKARTEAQAILERARSEIERERDAALESLRKEAVGLALAVAAKLLEEKLDAASDRQLAERYLADLGEGPRAEA